MNLKTHIKLSQKIKAIEKLIFNQLKKQEPAWKEDYPLPLNFFIPIVSLGEIKDILTVDYWSSITQKEKKKYGYIYLSK